MTESVDYWYRVDVQHYSVANEWGEHSYTSTRVQVTRYEWVRDTPRGVWLREWIGAPFHVRGKALKQRAVPTLDLAYQDAIARKDRHIAGCKARLKRAEDDRYALVSAHQQGWNVN